MRESTDLQSKRQRMQKNIAIRQRKEYFQMRRMCIIKEQEEQQYMKCTPQKEVWDELSRMMDRSRLHNELLQDIHHQNLLQKLEAWLKHSNNSKLAKYILSLLSNIILDDLSCQQRQKIVQMCINILKNEHLGDDLQRVGVIARNISCLAGAIRFLGQDEAIQIEQFLMGWIQKLVEFIIRMRLNLPNKNQQFIRDVVESIGNAFAGIFNTQPEYVGEIAGKLRRNGSTIINIVNAHHQVLSERSPMLKTPQTQLEEYSLLDLSLLTTYHTLSLHCHTPSFPLLFEMPAFIEVIILSLTHHRPSSLSSDALARLQLQPFQILNNLMGDFLEDEVGLQILLRYVGEKLANQTLGIAFMHILEMPSNRQDKLKCIVFIVKCSITHGGYLQQFMHKFRQYIIDLMFVCLRDQSSYPETTKYSLQVFCLFSADSQYFSSYFISKGGEALLDDVNMMIEEPKFIQYYDQLKEMMQHLQFTVRLQMERCQ